jgi:hypothetical protein
VLEQDFWRQSQVDLFSAPLDNYVRELRQHIHTRQGVGA